MIASKCLITFGCCIFGILGITNAEQRVSISTDFPGGSVAIESNEGATVSLKPKLDGGRDWFYWYFEATAEQPGEVTFLFPEKIAGFKNGAIGFQGPAVSEDGGATWRWGGSNEEFTSVREFIWTFQAVGESVRFAVTIPYTAQNFQVFADQHAKNSHFQTSELTTTRLGRRVELVQIGDPSDEKIPVLLTCRHHACETVASYLLEGFLESAMSETPAGTAFREHFVLFAVPFVDTDGVELGDQGKGRIPHDHNRDYDGESLFRSVQAIKELGREQKIRILLDLHCPTLVMDIHQRFYFAGPSDQPTDNSSMVEKFAIFIKAELPEGAPHGPVLSLSTTDKDRDKYCSGYFSKLDNMIMSATLETPFAPRKTKMEVDDVRTYGNALLHAFNQTFIASP